MQISGSAFVVTGAASGLGAATASWLRACGAQVLLTDLAADALAAQGEAVNAPVMPADVSNEADAAAVIQDALARFGALHGLINCAGIAPAQKVLGRDGVHTLARFQKVIGVNLVGTFNMLRLAAQAMSTHTPDSSGERGVIINTASIAAFEGQIGQAAYSASKAGVAGMTLPLARELARFGIRVMTIAPGVFDTPMLQAMPQAVRDALGANVPFPPRLGEGAEYAALVGHIIENPMLNGEVIRLDGALRMSS